LKAPKGDISILKIPVDCGQRALLRDSGKQRFGGLKAPLEQLDYNAYPLGFSVKALPHKRCWQPFLSRKSYRV